MPQAYPCSWRLACHGASRDVRNSVPLLAAPVARIDPGETPEAAALRETPEEVGPPSAWVAHFDQPMFARR